MNVKSNRLWPYAIAGCLLYGGGWLHSQFVVGVWPFGNGTTAGNTASIDRIANARSSIDHHDQDEQDHHDEHDEHDHNHPGHTESNSLELSETAKKNLGLSEEFLRPLELRDYQQTITVPAIIVDRPGRTRLPISASMTGIVTHVHAATGEAVEPGDLILEMRLTHEDLVTAQKEYLQSLGDRDIELKEIARLEEVANSGAISTKTLLDRQYNRDKLESLLRSQREALRLHGLTDDQISSIDSDRRLLTEIRVYAPGTDDHSHEEIQLGNQLRRDNTQSIAPNNDPSTIRLHSVPIHDANFLRSTSNDLDDSNKSRETEHDQHEPNKNQILVLQELNVQKGQIVNAGETLCVLADYAELLAEGQAFETEASQISAAKLNGWKASAVLGVHGKSERIEDLEIGWINNEIDPVTRTLKFYVTLQNQLLEDNKSNSGQRHITWRFRTGQRLELCIPIARWTDQIVLPASAVVREGIDSFVFQQNGDHFDRIPVHERYRDQMNVVIENDGAIFPGDVVALRGAHQMQMALKSRSGGGVDPHAGHNH